MSITPLPDDVRAICDRIDAKRVRATPGKWTSGPYLDHGSYVTALDGEVADTRSGADAEYIAEVDPVAMETITAAAREYVVLQARLAGETGCRNARATGREPCGACVLCVREAQEQTGTLYEMVKDFIRRLGRDPAVEYEAWKQRRERGEPPRSMSSELMRFVHERDEGEVAEAWRSAARLRGAAHRLLEITEFRLAAAAGAAGDETDKVQALWRLLRAADADDPLQNVEVGSDEKLLAVIADAERRLQAAQDGSGEESDFAVGVADFQQLVLAARGFLVQQDIATAAEARASRWNHMASLLEKLPARIEELSLSREQLVELLVCATRQGNLLKAERDVARSQVASLVDELLATRRSAARVAGNIDEAIARVSMVVEVTDQDASDLPSLPLPAEE